MNIKYFLFLCSICLIIPACGELEIDECDKFSNPIEIGTFSPTNAELSYQRRGHQATVLDNGKLLISGRKGGLLPLEVFDPNSLEVTKGDTLHAFHVVTLLDNGDLLITGGNNADGQSSTDILIYNTHLERLTIQGDTFLSIPRTAHAAVKLPTGKVLITGGSRTSDKSSELLTLTKINDTTYEISIETKANLNMDRRLHTTTCLDPNCESILFVGGRDASNNVLSTATLYRNQQFETITLQEPRINHTATLLNDGNVLIVGGNATVGDPSTTPASNTGEIYTPQASVTALVEKTLFEPRSCHTATLLNKGDYKGHVLILGGTNMTTPEGLMTIEIFNPVTCNVFRKTDIQLNFPRFGHTVSWVDSSLVIVSGNFQASDLLENAIPDIEIATF